MTIRIIALLILFYPMLHALTIIEPPALHNFTLNSPISLVYGRQAFTPVSGMLCVDDGQNLANFCKLESIKREVGCEDLRGKVLLFRREVNINCRLGDLLRVCQDAGVAAVVNIDFQVEGYIAYY